MENQIKLYLCACKSTFLLVAYKNFCYRILYTQLLLYNNNSNYSINDERLQM